MQCLKIWFDLYPLNEQREKNKLEHRALKEPMDNDAFAFIVTRDQPDQLQVLHGDHTVLALSVAGRKQEARRLAEAYGSEDIEEPEIEKLARAWSHDNVLAAGRMNFIGQVTSWESRGLSLQTPPSMRAGIEMAAKAYVTDQGFVIAGGQEVFDRLDYHIATHFEESAEPLRVFEHQCARDLRDCIFSLIVKTDLEMRAATTAHRTCLAFCFDGEWQDFYVHDYGSYSAEPTGRYATWHKSRIEALHALAFQSKHKVR